MLVRESISFKRGKDPKEALFGWRPGQLVTNDNAHNDFYKWIYFITNTYENFNFFESKVDTAGLGKIWNRFGMNTYFVYDYFEKSGAISNQIYNKSDLRLLNNKEKEIMQKFLNDPANKKFIEEYEKRESKRSGNNIKIFT